MTAIVGGQSIPTGVQMTGQVDVELSINQTWTVPGNVWAEVIIWTTNSSIYAEINGWQVYIPQSGTSGAPIGRDITPIKLGPGSSVTCRNGSYIVIRGVTFSNGS